MTNRFIHIILIAWLLLITITRPLTVLGDETISREYKIKVGLIYNLIQFLEYSGEIFSDPSTPFCIGIVGRDPFGEEMAVLKGKIAQNRKLVVTYFPDVSQIKPCPILFISDSERENLKHILDKIKGSNVLTISDIDQFAEQGGMVNIVTIDNRIRFKVNLSMTRRAGVKISAHFLRLVKIVDE